MTLRRPRKVVLLFAAVTTLVLLCCGGSVAVLLYGEDLKVLADKGKQIERVLRGIPGATDVKADYQANVQTLTEAVDAVLRHATAATSRADPPRSGV